VADDARVAAIVDRLRRLVAYRHEWDGTDTHEVGELLEQLLAIDAAPPPAEDEVVERVSAAIFESKHISLKYEQLQDEKKDDFRRYARAAIKAMGRKP
jgi:hypothetical protein